jgi:hypothetical protein
MGPPFRTLLLLLAAFSAPGVVLGDEPKPAVFPADAVEFFESAVRPLLAERCYECHGPRKQESNLRLDSREAMLEGGDSGAVIVPGEPEKSLLIAVLRHNDGVPEMPPSGKLGDDRLAAIERWLKLGAPWSDALPVAAATSAEPFVIRPEQRSFWSFMPVTQPPLPQVGNRSWLRTDVDAFILARLEAEGHVPAPPADQRTLLRRVTLDLIGLPPSPEEMAAFLADDREEAFAVVVDRLLASPRYGERMARLWLDVARYGEDQAHTFEARKYPQAFRYRDWLIDAFNRDLPYDEFIRQQIAADLYEDSGEPERLAALGYFACGPVYYGDKNKMDEIADRIDVLTRGFLGLTVACARCHDHKYDPIPTVDYYALAGVFASSEYVEVPLVSPEEVEAAEQALPENERKKKNRAKTYPHVHALNDDAQPKTLRVHVRGNADTLGPEAPRAFLQILSPDAALPLHEGSGRRQLAEAIASRDNPLTARVLVNRIWQQHFGEGIVRTPSNFGSLGERPTHPELLDYLAGKLIESGWSIKAVHREIVLSAAYQQSASGSPALLTADPQNRLWGRVTRRRLEVEAWRDSVLAVSGELDPTIGGPSLQLADDQNRRRTLYGFVSRHELNPLLRLFDFPDPNITSDRRSATTVPLQQLFVLNSGFMLARSRALAQRLAADASTDEARILRAFQLLFGREPSETELQLGLSYLASRDAEQEPLGAESPALSRWDRYAQALLSTNEFMHIE